jgi:RND family efflux transporter MFP subunit
MRILKSVFFIIALLAFAALFVHFKGSRGGAAAETVQPFRKDVIEAVYATGEVEPVTWLQVAPQLTARYAEVLVDDNAVVTKDQMLAKADDAAERAKLDEYESRLAQMKSEYDRNKGLLDKGYISQKAFEDASGNYDELQSRIDNQKLVIERMSLRSPIDGVILRRDIEPGEVKSPAQTVFWVGDPSVLRITAEVDEEDILKVKKGQAALLKSDAIQGKVLEGTVGDITPKGDPVNKNFRVRISLSKDTPLLIGMTVEVNIVTSKSENALVVPVKAVKDGAVWLAGTPSTRAPVETGRTDGKVVEILKGLSGNETIRAAAP